MKETRAEDLVGRRDLLKATGAALAFLTALEVAPEKVARSLSTTQADWPEVPGDGPDADVLIRMQGDLLRALKKTPAERRWIMVIDTRKCVGCHACTIACIAENKLPPGVVYRPVTEEEIGTYPLVTRRFTPKPCMQCDEPPCVPVCPVNATYKNEEGVIVMDYDQCIGCRYCITACPYSSRTFDLGQSYTPMVAGTSALLGSGTADDYERAANYEYGEATPRTGDDSPIGNVRKCHFCLHRVKQGMLPECVTTCIGRATMFGDANDATSVVSGMIAGNNVVRLKEEMGTEPRVYYLI